MQQIRTKWHHLVPLIDADEVYLTAPKDGKAEHWSKFDGNAVMLKDLIRQWGELPKFSIDEELLATVKDENYQQSLLDLKKAGVMQLPYPAMVVEFPMGQNRAIVILRDTLAPGKMPWEPQENPWARHQFYGIIFRVDLDKDGEYIVLAPAIISVEIEERNGVPWLALQGVGSGLFPDSTKLDNLVGATYEKDTSILWYALMSAMLLMVTSGVKKEVIETERLNRKRLNSNKEPIPKHTYIKIGHVYKSAESEAKKEYSPRRSPRPHWRRGHIKNVRHGAGRTQLKQIYIYPKLVAYHPEQPEPEPSQKRDYVVTK